MIATVGLIVGVGLPAGADNNDNSQGRDSNLGSAGTGDPPGASAGHRQRSGTGGHGNSVSSAHGTGSASNANSNEVASRGGSAHDGGTPAAPGPDPSRSEAARAASGPAVSGGGSPNSANHDCGAYCAAPGDPSGNGNGGGKAAGRPDAGTVGNADTKNPKGQGPDGGDGNRGYECDGNRGIARGNPAHTRNCAPPPSTTPPSTTPPPTPPPPMSPPISPPVTPTVVVSSVVTTVNPAQPGGQTTPRLDVLGTALERPNADPPSTAAAAAKVLGVTIERDAGALARTGANTGETTALGIGLIFGGAALSRVNRLRPSDPTGSPAAD
ncbi:MAG TPA: hypothetical protein VNA57_04745 [Acidimicrobiales bacterium]|nr:hypothetical protein [Acidimicrobiales bacterium]